MKDKEFLKRIHRKRKDANDRKVLQGFQSNSTYKHRIIRTEKLTSAKRSESA